MKLSDKIYAEPTPPWPRTMSELLQRQLVRCQRLADALHSEGDLQGASYYLIRADATKTALAIAKVREAIEEWDLLQIRRQIEQREMERKEQVADRLKTMPEYYDTYRDMELNHAPSYAICPACKRSCQGACGT